MASLPSRGGVLAGKLEFKFENNWPHVCAHIKQKERNGETVFLLEVDKVIQSRNMHKTEGQEGVCSCLACSPV